MHSQGAILPMMKRGYVGPLDGLTNFHAAYSVRRLLSSYTGPLVTLRRASDNAETDFSPAASGWLDDVSIAAWAGGDSFVAKWWDQYGTKHLLQATAASQPKYTAAATPEARPTLVFDGVDDNIRITSTMNSPQHIFSVAAQLGWTDTEHLFSGPSAGSPAVKQVDASPLLKMTAGGQEGEYFQNNTINSYFVMTYYFALAGTTYARRNSAQVNNVSQVGANSTGLILGCAYNSTKFANVAFSEFVVFSAAQATQTAIEAEQMAAYL